jgi:hypothetical protein
LDPRIPCAPVICAVQTPPVGQGTLALITFAGRIVGNPETGDKRTSKNFSPVKSDYGRQFSLTFQQPFASLCSPETTVFTSVMCQCCARFEKRAAGSPRKHLRTGLEKSTPVRNTRRTVTHFFGQQALEGLDGFILHDVLERAWLHMSHDFISFRASVRVSVARWIRAVSPRRASGRGSSPSTSQSAGQTASFLQVVVCPVRGIPACGAYSCMS